jgi:uncharacterized SAM-binding protein YcdF (DUF218 family)
VNNLFELLGIAPWKAYLTALFLPPVPFLLLALIGARLMLARRGWGWLLIIVSVLGLWFGSTMAVGRWLERYPLHAPGPLKNGRIQELRAENRKSPPQAAIVVVGAGMEPLAPEYGVSGLRAPSLERLRYGLWLSRETGIPVAYSGGPAWGQSAGSNEAETAARIATQDFQRPLRWTPSQAHDTNGSAAQTVPVLRDAGVRHIVLVTHGWHMPRARRSFEEAARASGITIEAAPMGLAGLVESPALDWMPSGVGYGHVRQALTEMLATLAH